MRRPIRFGKPPRQGVAAVEFALALPLFTIILLGVWELGRLVDVQQILDNAAREGGRQASTGLASSSQVQQTVLNYLSLAGINTTGAVVTVSDLTSPGTDPTLAGQLDQVQVTVTIPSDNVRWVLLNSLTGITELRASSIWNSMNDLPVNVSSSIPQ